MMVASWNVCMLHITYRNTVGLPPFPSSTPLFMDDGIDTALMGPSSVCGVWGVCSCHITFFNTLSHLSVLSFTPLLNITGSAYQDR